MADMSAPSGQAPAVAPPVRTDDEILPHNKWVQIGKRPLLPLPPYRQYTSNSSGIQFNMTRKLESTGASWMTVENVAKHGGFLTGDTGSTQDLPAPKLAKPARKPSISIPVASTQPAPTSAAAKSQEYKRKQATKTTDKPAKSKRFKRSISRKTRQPRSSPKSVGASEAKEVPVEEPQIADEDADYQKAVKESMKVAYALPKGPLPPVVIRKPELGKYQPLSEVPGKGKAKVIKEQVAHDLLSLQKHKKTSPADQYIFQRRVSEPTKSSFHDESPYDVLGQSNSEEESKKVALGAEKGGQDEGQAGPDHDAQAEDQTGSDAGAQAEGQAGSNPDETSEGQAGSNPDETSEGQAGPDPGDAKARVQYISSPVVYAGLDREHMDLDVADVSPQPSTEQLVVGFTATVYPNVQENLKLAIDEPVLLEEPASSSGTLSSLQHLSRDFSFGDQFFSEKHSDADKNAETEVELMVSIAVSEVVTDAVDWAMQAPLRNSFRDLPKADKKEILYQRMWESDSYKSHEVHMQLFEALEKSMNHDHSEELAQDLAEARKKKKKGHESPKMPPGSPSHQPPPPPPPAGPSGALGAPKAFESQVTPPPPPPTSTSQDSPSKGFAVPSPSKTAASTEHQAWTMPDVTLKPLISLTPADLDMDEAMGPDEQAQLSDDEDIGSAHIPTMNLRQDWWKPFEEERPTTPEPAWSICSSDVPTDDIATFMDSFCKRRGITELKPQDLEGPAYEIVKVFHPDVIHLQYQMEECHKLLTNDVDDPILRHNISKPLPLGGPPGQVTIQSDFLFNKDLEYLRYDSKDRRPALSISKMKVAYYPDAGIEQMVPDQFWIEEECKYDIAAMYGISHWWFQRQRFYIDRHTSEGDRSAVRTHMRILSVLGIESYQTQVNLTKPQWMATSFEYKHDYTVIESPRAVIFRDKYGVQMMMRFNEIHKFSDGTLQQIDEALDYRVKEFRINRLNPCLNTRFWTRKDVDRCNAFMFTIQRRLRTRRIFRNLESFVGGRVREGDYRLLKLCSSLRSPKSKRTIESKVKRSSKIVSLGHYSILLASSYTVKSSIHTDQWGTVVLATLFDGSEQRHFRSFITNINLQESRRLQQLAKKMSIHNSMLTLQTHYQ
nr:hypothetical protein [Tanacetum cinerariifolium]